MEKIIDIQRLRKSFKVHSRESSGFLSAIKSLVNRKFKIVHAVDDITFNVNRGSIHGLIGPNGSGKSTTIKILSGILYPTAGVVNVMGYVPWKQRREYVKRIGVFFGQKSQLGWEIPAIDTYRIHKEIYKIPTREYRNNLEFLIHGFEIEEIVKKPVRTLSLGEKMRCEIVCILLHSPDLVFLDEPTIGLDIIAKDIFRKLIKKLNKEKGTTFVLTTHDLTEVENLCDTATVINHGNIVFSNRLEKLKTQFTDKKIIEVTFSQPLPDSIIKELNIEMRSPLFGRISLDVGNTNFQQTIQKLLSSLPIQDLNIQTIDIESVIKLLYQRKNIQASNDKTLIKSNNTSMQ
jgi:ABC-2 type transport system ATP-binding protein